MTRNKAPKTAARERMAQTGEPYSVARRATAAGSTAAAGDTRPGDPAPLDDPGAPVHPMPAREQLSPEEQYAREAAARPA